MDTEQRWAESNRELVDELRAMIERDGPITFARFMEQALYHPQFGYYVHTSARPGRAGDFLTAPEADPIFGHTVARQIDEMWRRLGQPERFTLREYGAGAGTLARDILDGLRADDSGLLNAIRFEPVEINPNRLPDLRARFAEAGFSDRLAEPVPGEQITGCVLANEFVDAFPVHRVEMRNGKLQEIYATWQDGWFAETLGPPSSAEVGEYLANEGIALVEGQRAEINLGAAGWVAEVAGILARGYVLILDYGYPAPELYNAERRGGTLKAYYRHGVHEDPFRAVGEQDLTAHVDFTAIERAAAARGLRVLGLTTQADFLAGAGIGDLLVALQQRPGLTFEEYVNTRDAVIRMIDPGAMGRFRVMILGRDVPDEPSLRGLVPAI